MTRFDKMCNDHKEGDFILELYHRALYELLKERKIDEQLYESIKNPPLNHKRVLLKKDHNRVPCIPYVACFSHNFDDECMDYYTNGRGGWIRFTTKIPRFGNEGGLPNNHYDECMLLGFCSVEYDAEKVVEELKKMIVDFRNSDCDNSDYIRECIGECLSARSLAVKSPVDDNGKPTNVEGEIRLIYFVPEDENIREQMRDRMSPFEVVDDIHIAIPGIFDRGKNAVMPAVYSKDVGVLEHIQSECTEMRMHLSVERNSVYGMIHCLTFHI